MGVNASAQALGKLGGRARAASLTAAQRSAIARKAARARWAQRAPQPRRRKIAV